MPQPQQVAAGMLSSRFELEMVSGSVTRGQHNEQHRHRHFFPLRASVQHGWRNFQPRRRLDAERAVRGGAVDWSLTARAALAFLK